MFSQDGMDAQILVAKSRAYLNSFWASKMVNSSLPRPTLPSVWSAPGEGVIKINVDAAIFMESAKYGAVSENGE